MSARTHTLRDLAVLITQKRWLVLIPFALGVAVAPVLARYAPERYRSEALLLVIPQQVPKDYVTPTSNMRMRFVASDQISASLVEAAVDDWSMLAFPTGRKLKGTWRISRSSFRASAGISRARWR